MSWVRAEDSLNEQVSSFTLVQLLNKTTDEGQTSVSADTAKRANPLVLADLMRLAVSSSFTDKFWLYINCGGFFCSLLSFSFLAKP